jgi:hypothetical protein
MRQLAQKMDVGVANVSERFMRKVSRRAALRTGVLSGVTTIAALAAGEGVAKACKTESGCNCGPTYRCDHWGWGCPQNGCPSGMSICKNGSSYSCSCDNGGYNVQGYCCEYACGYWITCTGQGKGYGFQICYDCKGHGCEYWCTCLSVCQCCQCTNAREFRKVQAQIQARNAAS